MNAETVEPCALRNMPDNTPGGAIAKLSFARRDPWRRGLGFVAGAVAVSQLTSLALGWIGLLRAWIAIAVLAPATIAAVAWAIRRHRRSVDGGADGGPALPPERLRTRISLGLLGATLGLVALQVGLGGTAMIWDDLGYHAAASARWLVDGRISLPATEGFATYPGGHGWKGNVYGMLTKGFTWLARTATGKQ